MMFHKSRGSTSLNDHPLIFFGLIALVTPPTCLIVSNYLLNKTYWGIHTR